MRVRERRRGDPADAAGRWRRPGQRRDPSRKAVKRFLPAIRFGALAGSALPVWVATAFAQPYAYVSNIESASVSVVDTAANRVVATVPTHRGPGAVAAAGRGDRAYVATQSGEVMVIDTARNAVVRMIEVGERPQGLALSPDGSRLYVSNNLTATLSIVDTRSVSVVRTVAVGSEPTGVAVSPAGDRVFVVDERGRSISVLDAALQRVVQRIVLTTDPPAAPVGPEGIVVSPDGRRLYVTRPLASRLTVIDLEHYTVLEHVDIGPFPMGIAIAPDGTRLYVGINLGLSVAVVDTATMHVINSIPLPGQPVGVSLTPDGGRLYAAGGRLFAVDTQSGLVVGDIAVGMRPQAVGSFITGHLANPRCPLDLDADGAVAVPELIVAVRHLLDGCPGGPLRCDGDADSDGTVTVAELLGGIAAALDGCPAPPSPPPTPTFDPAVTPTPQRCIGDCNGDEAISIDEIVTGVAIARGTVPRSACPSLAEPESDVYEAWNLGLAACPIPLAPPSPDAIARIAIVAPPTRRGETLSMAIRLLSGGQDVAGVQGCLALPPDMPLLDCVDNAALPKRSGLTFRPFECALGRDCTQASWFLASLETIEPIPDGSDLFTCTAHIAADAALGEHPLTLLGLLASDSHGRRVALGAVPSTLRGTRGAVDRPPPCLASRQPRSKVDPSSALSVSALKPLSDRKPTLTAAAPPC